MRNDRFHRVGIRRGRRDQGDRGEDIRASRRSDLDYKGMAFRGQDLGEGKVEPGAEQRAPFPSRRKSRSHRLPALHGDPQGARAPLGVARVGGAFEHSVLDGDSGELARPDPEKREWKSLDGFGRDRERLPCPRARPEPLVGWEEVFQLCGPTAYPNRAESVRRSRRYRPASCRSVHPIGRSDSSPDLAVDDRAIADRGSDDPVLRPPGSIGVRGKLRSLECTPATGPGEIAFNGILECRHSRPRALAEVLWVRCRDRSNHPEDRAFRWSGRSLGGPRISWSTSRSQVASPKRGSSRGFSSIRGASIRVAFLRRGARSLRSGRDVGGQPARGRHRTAATESPPATETIRTGLRRTLRSAAPVDGGLELAVIQSRYRPDRP